MTQEGLEKLKKEKEELERNRPAAVLDLKKAREMGDLSENGYYKSARAKLSLPMAQLLPLRQRRLEREAQASQTAIS